MEGGLLLDVVVRKSATVLELLSSEDQALLVGRNALLVLDLGLDVIDGVGRLDLKSDCLTGESLHEDLHTTTEAENQMEGRLLLDVVVAESTSVFELLASEDETLLVRWDTFLVLDLGLHIVNSVGWLNLKCDGLASQSLNKNLHVDFWLFLLKVLFIYF